MNEEELERMIAERKREAEEVNSRLPEGLVLERYGNGAPWQGDGTYRGRDAYLRLRGNQASMTVFAGEAWESPVVASAVIYPYLEGEGNEYHGWLEGPDEVVEVAERLVAALAPYDPEENPTSQDLLRRAVERMSAAMEEEKGGGK